MVKITLDTRAFDRFARDFPRKFQAAAVKAMNQTAFQVRQDLHAEIGRVFHNPVALTRNAVIVKPATSDRLEAFVRLRDSVGKGTAPAKYLAPQIHGGSRPLKRFERALGHIGRSGIAAGRYAMPGKGARLNSYGNISQGQITQILSGLGVNPDGQQNTPASRRGRGGLRIKKGGPRSYFIGQPGGKALGVWQRTGQRQVKPALIFVRKAPRYAKRFNFYAVALRTAKRTFQINFNRAMSAAAR